MPFLHVDDRTVPLRVGQTRIGSSEDADIRVATPKTPLTLAVVELGGQHATIRRASLREDIRVNGVALGAEPAPLLHGDRIEVAGRELRFAEESQSGRTLVVPALDGDSDAPLELSSRRVPRIAPSAAESDRGRLISLVDGREYPIAPRGMRLGREASSDIVVPTGEVSRRHAEVVRGRDGFELRDTSTNGVWVNGERIRAPQMLVDGDVVRVGVEEFRFHQERATPADTEAASLPTPVAAVPAFEAEPLAAVRANPVALPVLATLEIVNEGVWKGRRLEVRRALTHVGRGEHNDLVIADESVSDAHAKLQRREHGWVLVDDGSTNGTYVNGLRITEEREIEGEVDLRFGGVKMKFRPSGVPAGEGDATGASTRLVAKYRPSQPAPVAAADRTIAPAPRGARVTALVSALLMLILLALTAR